ncbi:hypothetical protein Sjap_024922 [Stephania japonica]|uniref:Uncharacterized protein n=1 Tax=Stephania japonica TaxID=461633 RepID=A0AAP0EGF4_9MAGN
MGNYISCTLSPQTLKHTSKATKVVFPNGEVRQLREPTKAAELMFENPNYFLVNAQSLQIGRRFSALNADEDLEIGNVYVMFLMKKLNSVVTAADMGALFIVASSTAKRASGGRMRILPEYSGSEAGWSCSPENEGPRLSLEGVDDGGDALVSEFQHRVSMSRSRKPMLETIVEESVYAR